MGKKRGRPKKARPPQQIRPHVPLRDIVARCGDGNGKMGPQALREIILYYCDGNYDATEEDSRVAWELYRISADSAKQSRDPRDIQRTIDAFAKLKGVNQKNVDQLIRVAQMEGDADKETRQGSQVNVQFNFNDRTDRLSTILGQLGVDNILESPRPPQVLGIDAATGLPFENGSPHSNGSNAKAD